MPFLGIQRKVSPVLACVRNNNVRHVVRPSCEWSADARLTFRTPIQNSLCPSAVSSPSQLSSKNPFAHPSLHGPRLHSKKWFDFLDNSRRTLHVVCPWLQLGVFGILHGFASEDSQNISQHLSPRDIQVFGHCFRHGPSGGTVQHRGAHNRLK